MIRPTTASSTRCREVFPSAGFPPLPLGLEPELALVLEPGALARADAVVMGRSSPSGNELSGPGAPRRRLGGERPRRRTPVRRLRAAMRPLSGVSGHFLRFGAMGRFYAPLGRSWESRGESRRSVPARASQSRNAAPLRGFRKSPPTVWGNGALLCPSGAVAEMRRWGWAAGWSRRGSSGVAAGGFRRLRRRSAW